MKLNTKYYSGDHCPCCGRNIHEIWNHLINQAEDSFKKQTWKGHYRYRDKDYFHDVNVIHNCPQCGTEYNEDDTDSRFEDFGFDGISALQQFPVQSHCHECGHVEEWE